MKQLRNITLILGIMYSLTLSQPASAQAAGSSCDNAIHIGTGLTNLSFPKKGTYWFEASTFDLPMDVIFIPSNQESTLIPQAWADFRCDSEPYADDIAKALGYNEGASSTVQMPTKLNLKPIKRNGLNGYQFTMDTTYRDMIRAAGITRNVQVFIRVIVEEAGSTDVDPFVILHECLDNTRYLEETDTIHVATRDSVTPFVFPLSQWAKDSVRLMWQGVHSPATVYLATDNCHFTPDISDPNCLYKFEIPKEGIKKFTDKDIKALIKQLGSGGVYFGKILSDEAADMLISLVPENTVPGIHVKYDIPVTVKAQDTTAFYFKKEWQATRFELATTRDAKVYMGLRYTIDPADPSTYFFSCDMDYDADKRVRYLNLSDKEMADYCGRQTDDNEKYMFIKVVSSHAAQLSATEWATSDHANLSYQLRDNSPIAFAGNLTVKDRIYRMRYADWQNCAITVTRDGEGNPSVKFAMGITATSDWSNLPSPTAANSVMGSYYEMSRSKKTYTYEASVVNSWGAPSDPDGFYYWVFNSNKRDFNVVFTREQMLGVTAHVKDTAMGYLLGENDEHVNSLTKFGELGTPVVLEAVAKEGYRFAHWEDRMTNILSTSSRMEYTIIGNTVVYAVFRSGSTTRTEEVEHIDASPVKVLLHGNIFILRDDQIFDLLGHRVE